MQKIICKALDEKRLAYKVLDHNLQACNGGTFDYRPYLPSDDRPGEWLPKIKAIKECHRGWHFTLDPLVWPGCVVFLVETTARVNMFKNRKQAFATGRLLKRVWHDEVIDLRLWVKTMAPQLRGANLAGARLVCASLAGANLKGANLEGASLGGANLRGTNLVGANLAGANLIGANLEGASLARANLAGANLRGTNLAEAYLGRAYLVEANLVGANLKGASLLGASRLATDPPIPGWKVKDGILVMEGGNGE